MSTTVAGNIFKAEESLLVIQLWLTAGLALVLSGGALWTLAIWLRDARSNDLWGPDFILFSVTALCAVLTFVLVFPRLKRYRAVLASGEAKNYVLTVQPDGITISTDDQTARFDWMEFASVSSDKALLHDGLLRRETYSALLLIKEPERARATLDLRWSLRTAALRRAVLDPFEIPGMVVIPTYFFAKPEARNLFDIARQSHEQFRVAQSQERTSSGHA